MLWSHTSRLHVIILSPLSNLSLPELICKCACTVIKETSVPLQKRGHLSPPSSPPPLSGNSPRMRRGCHVRTSQADVYRSPTLLMHLWHWCSSQVIIIKDIQHLRTSLIMVYMDFEALMKNSLPLWVYCVCTNCGDGVRQECPPPPPPDRLLQDVVMENKKIRFGRKLDGYREVIRSRVFM